MRFRLLMALLTAASVAVLCFGGQPRAQSVTQAGPSIGGHLPMYVLGPGQGFASVMDSGFASGLSAAGTQTGAGLTEFLQVDTPGQPGSGPFGSHSCWYGNPPNATQRGISNPGGYYFLCLDAALNGVDGQLSFGAGGGANPIPFNCNINGISIPNCLIPTSAGGPGFGVFTSQFSGYDPTGGTDSTTSLQSCVNAAGAGGTCWVNMGATLEILGNISIPAHTTLKCGYGFADSEDNISLFNTEPAIKLDQGHTIAAAGPGAKIANCLIYRNGMTFPAPNPSGYAGTALSDGGNTDFTVTDSVVLGFGTCIDVSGSRPWIVRVNMDCNPAATPAAFYVHNGNHDSGYFDQIKIQPIATGNGSCSNSLRSGVGFLHAGINYIGWMVSQNFLVGQIDIEAYTIASSLWSDFLVTCTSTAYGMKFNSAAQIANLNVNGANDGILLDCCTGLQVANVFLNLIARDCVVINSPGELEAINTVSTNVGASYSCGRFGIHYADATMSGGLQVNQLSLTGVTGSPEIMSDYSIALGAQLRIGDLFTNISSSVSPYSSNISLGPRVTLAVANATPAPTVACSGIGGGTCSVNSGSVTLQGAITLNPSGSPASNGVATLTFSPPQATGRSCTFTPDANWGNGATVHYQGVSPTQIAAVWNNLVSGTPTALTPSQPYTIAYNCLTW